MGNLTEGLNFGSWSSHEVLDNVKHNNDLLDGLSFHSIVFQIGFKLRKWLVSAMLME